MTEQAKILRVFKLIGLLKSRPRSIEYLARELETTTRTIYRYLNLLEELGFLLDKDWDNRYFIHTDPGEEDKTMFFTAEESTLMNEMILSGLRYHPLKESIQKKLFLNSEIKELPEQLVRARLGKMVEQLVNAINHSNQVILKNYHSGHSQRITDRLIEPFDFGQNYETVVAYEPESQLNKYFKLERIGAVIELDKPWRYETRHEKPTSDIFGISGPESILVDLSMTLKAYLLLREEFPKSLPYLRKSDDEEDRYLFAGPVNGLKGMGRFVMGLIGEISVIGPRELKDYITEKFKEAVDV